MTGGDENNPNRTVFRPSPLQGLRKAQAAPLETPAESDASPDAEALFGASPRPRERLRDDDIPRPPNARGVRNRMVTEAAPLLALAASIRAGRARMSLPDLHAASIEAITALQEAIARADYSDDERRRCAFALCATIDDIAQNLPGQSQDAAKWATDSLLVRFFNYRKGGDETWRLIDEALARPSQSADLIELYHACLAAGFEGRFRTMSDGSHRLREIMTQLYGALDHVRQLSSVELSPMWRGQPTPMRKVGFWSILALAAGGALAFLFVVYVLLRVVLAQTGTPAMAALETFDTDQSLRLSRPAPPPAPAPTTQLQRIQGFLAPQIAQGLVRVEADPASGSIRVRTTVGQLFESGSDQLDPAWRSLIDQIGLAIEGEKGSVGIEGYTDSQPAPIIGNDALSQARANTVANVIRAKLSHPERVTAKGMGERPTVAPNDTPDGRALNRRVEFVIPQQDQ